MSELNDMIRRAARPKSKRRRQPQDAPEVPDGTPGDGVRDAEPTPTMSEVMDAAIHYAARRGRR
jgi:hypothetical protein